MERALTNEQLDALTGKIAVCVEPTHVFYDSDGYRNVDLGELFVLLGRVTSAYAKRKYAIDRQSNFVRVLRLLDGLCGEVCFYEFLELF